MNPEALQRGTDELDIREVLTRYCRAVDRGDVPLLKSVYWPEATDDHGIFVGSGHDFAEWIVPMLKRHTDCTQHLIANCWVQLSGRSAYTETYIRAYHRLRDDDRTAAVAGGRYLDRLEKRGEEWRIAERQCVFDWQLNAGPLLGGEEPTRELLGVQQQGPDDPSYAFLAGNRVPESQEDSNP